MRAALAPHEYFLLHLMRAVYHVLQGLSVAVSVDAEAFTVAGHREYNQASGVFTIHYS